MNKSRRSELIRELREQNDLYANVELLLLNDKKAIKTYDLLVFSISVKTIQELKKVWESLSNEIALIIQSDLEKTIELWNVYIFYFVEQNIEDDESKALKFNIENDTYSARKIVIDNSSDKNEKVIFDKLLAELSVTSNAASKDKKDDPLDKDVRILLDAVENNKVESSYLDDYLNKML